MSRTFVVGTFITTTVIVMAVVVYVAFNHREVSDSPHAVKAPDQTKIISHEVPSVNQVAPAEVPTSLNPSPGSGTARLVDKAELYSIELPKGWSVVHEGLITQEWNALTRPSWIGAGSPDLNVVGNSEIMDAPGHIANGASFEAYVFNQDIGQAPSHMNISMTYVSKEEVFVDGERGELSTYKEHNTSYPDSGVMYEAYVQHLGNYFTFRIAYNPKTYPQGEKTFVKILQSVKFTKR